VAIVHTQFVRVPFSELLASVVRHKANDGIAYMQSERGLNTVPHSLEWILVLRIRLPTPAARCLVLTAMGNQQTVNDCRQQQRFINPSIAFSDRPIRRKTY